MIGSADGTKEPESGRDRVSISVEDSTGYLVVILEYDEDPLDSLGPDVLTVGWSASVDVVLFEARSVSA